MKWSMDTFFNYQQSKSIEMETYESEQRNQFDSNNLSDEQTVPSIQRQHHQLEDDEDNMINSEGDSVTDEEDEMFDEDDINDETEDDEMLSEDNIGTGGGMSRENEMNRGTMSAS